MLKSIIATVITIVVGFVGCAVFSSWNNAQELGVVLAVAVMGGFIIFFNDRKK